MTKKKKEFFFRKNEMLSKCFLREFGWELDGGSPLTPPSADSFSSTWTVLTCVSRQLRVVACLWSTRHRLSSKWVYGKSICGAVMRSRLTAWNRMWLIKTSVKRDGSKNRIKVGSLLRREWRLPAPSGVEEHCLAWVQSSCPRACSPLCSLTFVVVSLAGDTSMLLTFV